MEGGVIEKYNNDGLQKKYVDEFAGRHTVRYFDTEDKLVNLGRHDCRKTVDIQGFG